MWPFSKKTEPSGCKEGAVCAWEFEGNLYKTKEDRDRAEREYNKREYRNNIIKILEHYQNKGYFDVGDFSFYERGERTVVKVRMGSVADALVNHWGEISNSIYNLKKLSGN